MQQPPYGPFLGGGGERGGAHKEKFVTQKEKTEKCDPGITIGLSQCDQGLTC